MSVQPLFTPLRMSDLDVPNRIVMAPLTRMRARHALQWRPDSTGPGRVQTPVHRQSRPGRGLATGAPLAEVDRKTVYASGPRGYTDDPTFRLAAAE